MSELKSCPFCLADLVATTSQTLFEHPLNECFLEGCLVSTKSPFQMYAWNTRSDEARIRRETIDECEEVMSLAWAKQKVEPFPDVDAALTHCHIRIRALGEPDASNAAQREGL